ncbi:unnamed protein product [[Candida] boidinii]|nr:unnamed protein product [[Candida] boidinii]
MATRCSIHQQFNKNKLDLKNSEIMKITANWYEINKERRNMDNTTLGIPDYYQFNSNITDKNIKNQEIINELVDQRNSLFWEISSLQGLNKNIGFPSSLNNLSSCSNDEIDDDLKLMGII